MAAGRAPLSKKAVHRKIQKLKAFVQKHKNTTRPHPALNSEKIRIFSDCSGIGSEVIALALLGLKDHFQVVGGSEIDSQKRVLMHSVHKTCGLAGNTMDLFTQDVWTRDPCACESADVYVGFVGLAKGKAWQMAKKGALPFLGGLKYIAVHKPKLVLLENVARLLSPRNSTAQKVIRKTFEALSYTTRVKILNSKHHGVPQSRPRVWIVAVRKPKHEFRFPKKLDKSPPPLKSFLDRRDVGSLEIDLAKFKVTAREAEGLLHGKDYRILDTGSSEKFTHVMREAISPCLTRTRCKQKGGYVVPRLRRELRAHEMGLLQGVPRGFYDAMLAALRQETQHGKAQCESIVAAAFGDGMTISVLMRLLSRGLRAAGLWPRAVPWQDHWEEIQPQVAVELPQSLFLKHI